MYECMLIKVSVNIVKTVRILPLLMHLDISQCQRWSYWTQ